MKVEIEIMRTRTVTIEESAVVELNVPKSVLVDAEDDNSAIIEWIENSASESVQRQISQAMEPCDESEDIDYNGADVLE